MGSCVLDGNCKFISSKHITHYSVQRMRDHIRNIVNQDAMNACTEKTKRNNYETVIDDLNNLLFAA